MQRNYLADFPAPSTGVPVFAAGGAAPGGPAGAPPAAAGPPATADAGGGDPMAAGAGGPDAMGAPAAPMGAGTDPAQAGADQAGQDVVGQLEGLAKQYLAAPSPQLEKEITQLVVQAFAGDPAGAGAPADPMATGQAGAMGGAMPPAAAGGAPGGAGAPAPTAPAGGMPTPGTFRRGGPVPQGIAIELPTTPQPRRARLG